MLLFTCNHVGSVGEIPSSSGCMGWATLFYCGTLWAFHIIIFQTNVRKNVYIDKHLSIADIR